MARNTALLYARVSAVQTGAETSPAVQLERCLRLAAERGRTVDPTRDIYSDDAKGQHSAFTRENVPQWERLEQRALTDPDVADVIVDTTDRAYRNTRLLLDFENRLKAVGVKLVTVDSGEVETDSPTGMLSFTMRGVLAEMHARDTSYRIKTRHYDALRARGLWLGHQAPPGLKRVGQRFDVHLVAGEKLPLIVEFLRLYVADHGTPSAAQELEKRGLIPPGHSERWRITFRRVLDRLEWYDGILDPALLQAARQEFARRRDEHLHMRRPKKRILLMWQLLVCAVCGRRYTAGTSYTTYGRGRYVSFQHGLGPRCSGVQHISELKADKQALKWLSSLPVLSESDRDQVATVLSKGPETGDHEPDIALQLHKLEQRLAGYEQMRADGDVSRDTFREKKKEIEQQMSELAGRRRAETAGPRWTYENARLLVDRLLETNWPGVAAVDPETVNRVLRTLCQRVTVSRGSDGKHLYVPVLDFELAVGFEWLAPVVYHK